MFEEKGVRFVGIYANGMQIAILAELRLLNYAIDEHYHKHRAIVFKSRALKGDNKILPLCFLHIFQLVGDPAVKGCHYEPVIGVIKPEDNPIKKRSNNFRKKQRLKDERAIAEATRVLENHIEQFCDEYFRFLDRPWRITCERQGDHAFSGEDVCKLFGSLAHNKFAEARDAGIEISNVSLKHSEVEVFIFVSNVMGTQTTPTIEKNNVLKDISDSGEKSEESDLWFFGITKTLQYNEILKEKNNILQDNCKANEKIYTSINKVPEHLKNLPSSTDESIAACLSVLTVTKYFSDLNNISFLDPMCGIGTIPMVFQRVCKNIGKTAFVVGTELKYDSLKIANQKCQEGPIHRSVGQNEDLDQNKYFSHPNIILANTLTLPFRQNLFDLVIVDPPWGHRHGKNHEIMKNMFRWMMEWVRVLKFNGILGIVTIRTKQVLHEYKSHFCEGRGLELIETLPFDNSGMSQCCYFVFRKTENTQTAKN